MEEKIYKTIELENNQVLVIFDASRAIARDASVVRMKATMEVKICRDLFVTQKISDTEFAHILETLGSSIVYEYRLERNMVLDREKDEILENLVKTFLNNTGQYICRPNFPEKLVLKEYRERIEKKRNTRPGSQKIEDSYTHDMAIKGCVKVNSGFSVRGIFLLAAMVSALLFIPQESCLADIYMYIDRDGVVHYTNTPTSSGYVLYIREKLKKRGKKIDPRAYDNIIHKACARHGLEFFLVKAVIRVESGFNPRAVSSKGAKGLMQIMPENYKALSVSDPFDPSQNIMAGTLYLKRLLKRYQNKLPLALAAYNAGPGAVDMYQRIPPYTETQDYVQKVMSLYSWYKKS